MISCLGQVTASWKVLCWHYVLGPFSLSIRGAFRSDVFCGTIASVLRAFAVLMIGILDAELTDGICVGTLIKSRQTFGDDFS